MKFKKHFLALLSFLIAAPSFAATYVISDFTVNDGADLICGWDDSALNGECFTIGNGLQTSGLTLSAKYQMSITADGSGLKLSGDATTPGNSKYYGTNGSGTKGFFNLPTFSSIPATGVVVDDSNFSILTGTDAQTVFDSIDDEFASLDDVAYSGDYNDLINTPSIPTQYTDEMAQDAVAAMSIDTSTIDVTYTDATPELKWDLINGSVTFAKFQNINTDRLIGRDTPSTGPPEEISVSGGVEFTGSAGIQTSAFTGDATKTAGGTALTLATVNSNVGSFGTASSVGTFTATAKGLIIAASNTPISISSGGVTDFVEAAQDATGAMVDSTLVYVDATPLLTRAALTGAITASQGSNTTALGSFASLDLKTALTDETGSGAAVFANTPTLVTPVLGSATATSITSGSFISNNADPADAGIVRLGNAETVAWEANPAGTDLTITMDANNIFTASTPINATTGFRIGNAAASGKILIGNGTNYVASTPTYPNASATALKIIRSDGTNFIASTATFSDTPSTAGKVMVSDGTNWITSTPTFPNASATSGKFIRSDGTNWIASTPTLPTTAGTSGKIVISDGTNFVSSTPTYPNASATAGKLIRSDGTNYLASTFTIPDTYAQGDIIYASATSVFSALAKNTTATRYLSNTGTTNNPAWAQIDVTNGITGSVPIANGGTAGTTAATARSNLGAANIAGDTFTGLIQFSGTGHAGLKANNLTTTQRNALTASAGMLVYDTTVGDFYTYNTGWVQLHPPVVAVDYVIADGSTFVVGELFQAANTTGTSATRATLSKNFIFVGDGAATSRPEKRDLKHYLGRMPIQSTLHYVPTHLANSLALNNQTMLTGFTYFIPTAIEIPFTQITLEIGVDTLGVGNMRLGLYNDSTAGDHPGTKIAVSSNILVTTTGLKTAAFTGLSQKPGKYWIMAEFDTNQTGIHGSYSGLNTDTAFSGQQAYGGGHVVNVAIEAFGTDLADYTGTTLTQAVAAVSQPWVEMTAIQ